MFKKMNNSKKIFLAMVMAAFAMNVTLAQENLTKEITLEKDVAPLEKKAVKKNELPKVKKIAELIERMTHEGVESCGCDGYEGHFGLLHAQNMGAVLRQTSLVPAEELFRDFWYKGTVSVLFGDNGIGKSVLAMQIAKTVAEAHPDELLVYLDTEMTRRQMKRRCHDAETGEDKPYRWFEGVDLQHPFACEPGKRYQQDDHVICYRADNV